MGKTASAGYDTGHPNVRRVERAEEWDAALRQLPQAHLLQSFRWGELKARYGWTVERLLAEADGGMAAAQVLWRTTPLGPFAYVPRGPVLHPPGHDQAAQALLQALHHSARKRRAVFVKLEPHSTDPAPWPQFGFRATAQSVQPRATLVLPLTEGLDALRRRQHHKTRYNIGLAARRGVRIRTGDLADVPAFFRLMEETGRRDGFAIRPERYFYDMLALLGDQVELLLAEHEGDLLAGIIVGKFGQEAIYLYGASAGHKRNLMPTYLLQWEAIRRAQEQGFARYDFWGIPEEVANEPPISDDALPLPRAHQRGDLWGVYRFKRGFGGQVLLYCGALDYVYRPLPYVLWQRALPLVRRVLRRSQGVETG